MDQIHAKFEVIWCTYVQLPMHKAQHLNFALHVLVVHYEKWSFMQKLCIWDVQLSSSIKMVISYKLLKIVHSLSNLWINKIYMSKNSYLADVTPRLVYLFNSIPKNSWVQNIREINNCKDQHFKGSKFTMHNLLCIIHDALCAMHKVQFKMHITQGIMHNTKCKIYNAQCTT